MLYRAGIELDGDIGQVSDRIRLGITVTIVPPIHLSCSKLCGADIRTCQEIVMLRNTIARGITNRHIVIELMLNLDCPYVGPGFMKIATFDTVPIALIDADRLASRYTIGILNVWQPPIQDIVGFKVVPTCR